MKIGTIVFLSGVVLLIFSIILGIIFWVKKPQYIPENAAYDGSADKNTKKLRSGYPTDRLTIRRESKQTIMPGTAVLQENTARLRMEQATAHPYTVVLPDTELLPEQKTEKLGVETVPLADGTAPLADDEDTVQLHSCPTVTNEETEVLDISAESSLDSEQTSGTTPLSTQRGE